MSYFVVFDVSDVMILCFSKENERKKSEKEMLKLESRVRVRTWMMMKRDGDDEKMKKQPKESKFKVLFISETLIEEVWK